MRYALSIKIFPRRVRPPHNYAALVFLVLRGGNNIPYFADVVGFGTDHLATIAVHQLRPDALLILRQLPRQNTGAAFQAHNPWLPVVNPAYRPYVSVPAVDMFFMRRGAPGQPPLMLPGVPANAEPWDFDLWKFLARADLM